MMMTRLKTARRVLKRHAAFIGPGLVAAVAYVDPGNWATDLEAGARWGYKLLFIVFLAGLAAVCLQVMSVRLGAVTSKSLPRNTRELILGWEARWPQHRRWFRTLLYSLWVVAEIAIIATDLAELIGSAIALNLLFPKLPLWAGVLITAVDVMIVLIFFRSDSGRQGMLLFEIVIVALVLAVFVSFMILLDMVKPVWRDVFHGLVPSKTLFAPGALYVGIGIIGATVMPHALFLGSALAGVDRLNMLPNPPKRRREPFNNRLPALNPAAALRRRLRTQPQATDPEIPLEAVEGPEPAGSASAVSPQLALVKTTDKDDEYEAKMQDYEKAIRKFDRIRWVNLHVWHASVDTAYSLLGFALTINSSILTLAGATFFYGDTGASADDADLNGAHKLVSEYVGKAAGIIFALALLCAGQSASITATLAGQIVSEGFLEWKTSPMVRRLITRLIGVVPAAVVASAIGNRGLNTMLVASQVILCIVLPTVTIPLVYMCASKDFMVVEGPVEEDTASNNSTEERAKTNEVEELDISDTGAGPSSLLPRHSAPPTRAPSPDVARDAEPAADVALEEEPAPGRRRKYFTSPKWYSGLGWLLNLVLVLANGYVIVTLAMGQS